MPDHDHLESLNLLPLIGLDNLSIAGDEYEFNVGSCVECESVLCVLLCQSQYPSSELFLTLISELKTAFVVDKFIFALRMGGSNSFPCDSFLTGFCMGLDEQSSSTNPFRDWGCRHGDSSTAHFAFSILLLRTGEHRLSSSVTCEIKLWLEPTALMTGGTLFMELDAIFVFEMIFVIF